MTDYSLQIKDNIKKLTTPCVPYDFANPPIDPDQLSTDLIRTMHEYGGVGLAANQIGLPYRVFVMRGDPENFVCFNPRVVMPSTETIVLEEGCLSFPGLFVKITRPRHVRVRFQTPSGETVTRQFVDLTARIFQHELDHLDGLLFYNRASRIERDRAKKRVKKHGFIVKEKTSYADGVINSAEFALAQEYDGRRSRIPKET